jgi:hypothetical protein
LHNKTIPSRNLLLSTSQNICQEKVNWRIKFKIVRRELRELRKSICLSDSLMLPIEKSGYLKDDDETFLWNLSFRLVYFISLLHFMPLSLFLSLSLFLLFLFLFLPFPKRNLSLFENLTQWNCFKKQILILNL